MSIMSRRDVPNNYTVRYYHEILRNCRVVYIIFIIQHCKQGTLMTVLTIVV